MVLARLSPPGASEAVVSNEALDPIARIRALDRLLMVVEVDGQLQGAMRPGLTYAGVANDVGVDARTVSRWVTGPAGKQWLTWRLAIDAGASDEDAIVAAMGDVRVSGGAPPPSIGGNPAPAGDPLDGLEPHMVVLECLASALHLEDALAAAMIEPEEWAEWMRIALLSPGSPDLAGVSAEEAEWCRWLRKAARAAEARCKLTLCRSIVTGGSSAAQLQLLGRRWREQFGITAASQSDAGEVDERPDEELDAIIAAASPVAADEPD